VHHDLWIKQGIIRYIDVHDINFRPPLEDIIKELKNLRLLSVMAGNKEVQARGYRACTIMNQTNPG
jgi:hypothetical protein